MSTSSDVTTKWPYAIWLGATAACVVLLAAPSQADAQLGLVETAVGPLEQLVDGLMNLKERCIEASREAAGTVFIGLATIHLLWVAQQTLLRGGDLSGGVGAFTEQLIIVSLFAVVVREGPAWGQDIVDFLRGVGRRVSGSPYVPQTLFDLSVELFMKNAGILNFGPNLMYAASMALSCTIAAIMFIAQLEATIVLSIGSIVLGFGGAVWTRSLATRYFQMALSSGLRLMLLEVLQGMSMRHLGDAMKVALQGGTKALEATATLVGAELFTVLLMLALPLVFHALSSGSISTGVESMLSRAPMMLAGGGVASAVMSSMQARASVAGVAQAEAGATGASAAAGAHSAEQRAASAAEFMSHASGVSRRPSGGGPIPSPHAQRAHSALDAVQSGPRHASSSGAQRGTTTTQASRSSEAAASATGLPGSWRGANAGQSNRAASHGGFQTSGSPAAGHESTGPWGNPSSRSAVAEAPDGVSQPSVAADASHDFATALEPVRGESGSAGYATAVPRAQTSAPTTATAEAGAEASASAGLTGGSSPSRSHTPRAPGPAHHFSQATSVPPASAAADGQMDAGIGNASDSALSLGAPASTAPRAAQRQAGGNGRAVGAEAGTSAAMVMGSQQAGTAEVRGATRPPAREGVHARRRLNVDELSAAAALNPSSAGKGSV